MKADLPPELAAFAALLDAQPTPVRDAFNYLLCLVMAERGALRPVATCPGVDGEVAVFRSSAGKTFTIVRPPLAPDIEAPITAALRDIRMTTRHNPLPRLRRRVLGGAPQGRPVTQARLLRRRQ